jgi:uncharacterized protein
LLLSSGREFLDRFMPCKRSPNLLQRFFVRAERSFLYYMIRLFRIKDASERVARGFALGLIVNFFPTFGFGVFISGFFARLLGGNAIAGFVGGAALTFFWIPLFYLNMLTGGWVQGRLIIRDPSELTEARIQSLVWGTTFTTGAILNSLVVGGIAYCVLRLIFRSYRVHGLAVLHRLMKHHQRKVLELNRGLTG